MTHTVLSNLFCIQYHVLSIWLAISISCQAKTSITSVGIFIQAYLTDLYIKIISIACFSGINE